MNMGNKYFKEWKQENSFIIIIIILQRRTEGRRGGHSVDGSLERKT